MTAEVHISSLVVHARPEGTKSIETAIGGLEGAEVHGVSEQGKLVLTLETINEGEMLSRIEEINRIAGRQAIPGVPFDVGRPIIQSMKISTAMVLGTDHVAIIHLPRATEENPPIFVFMTTRYIESK